jgi:hypothetical protein
MAIVNVTLLDAKTDTTPGEPVAVNTFVNGANTFIRTSDDFSASAPVPVSLEVSDTQEGPWVDFGVFWTIETTAPAGKLFIAGFPDSNRYIPWVRAKLGGNGPASGSVSMQAFIKQAY